MNVVNLTPHEVCVVGPDGEVVRLPRGGEPVRCDVAREVVGHVDLGGAEVPLVEVRAGAVVGLPPPAPGTLYLVSRVVAEAARRDDVCYPDDLVRDGAGAVVGCRSLGRPVPPCGTDGSRTP